ncbi:MAG: DUF1330 domain-containing protein [Porticoccaceae bacterium]
MIDISKLAELDQDKPVVMLNLLRYRDQADFPEGFVGEPCSGSEAYGMYAKATMPLVEKVPVKIVYAGHAVADLIMTADEHWDDILIVEYPSVSSFIALMNNPEYQKTLYLRTAALSSSRLIAMQDGLKAQLL